MFGYKICKIVSLVIHSWQPLMDDVAVTEDANRLRIRLQSNMTILIHLRLFKLKSLNAAKPQVVWDLLYLYVSKLYGDLDLDRIMLYPIKHTHTYTHK